MEAILARSIAVHGPFDWQLMLRYARRRRRDRIDMVYGDSYSRLVVHNGRRMLARASGSPAEPGSLCVSALGIDQAAEPDDLDYAEQAVRRVFAIDQSPQPFYDRVAQDRVLGPLSKQLYGLRPLGSPTIFEMLVTAILGQQISMTAAHAIKERLVLRLGAMATIDGRTYHAFPTPDRIAMTTGDELVALKFSRRKAEYVRDLATAVSGGYMDLEALRGQSHAEILEYLMAIRGIGRWTAEYVLLRGYGDPDALPAGDAGLRRQVTRHYALSKPPTEAELSAIAEVWRPFRSWATLYLWSAEWAAPS